jgi:phosphoribosylformimino-5-aminoimidazole carboxamide ribotide isomerase
MYKNDKLVGGHVIMLGNNCDEAALASLKEYPFGLQIGGKVNILF